MKFLGKVLSISGAVIAGVFAIDNFVIERVQTRVAEPLRKEILAYRSADFEHFNSKLDRIENKIDKLITHETKKD